MHRIPGSQSRWLLKQKEDIARQLIQQGLTDRQIFVQLNCSRNFVRRIRRSMTDAETASM